MKIVYKKINVKNHSHLVTVRDATSKELKDCDRWLQINLKVDGYFGNYMSKYVNIDDEKVLEIKFQKEIDVTTFKSIFE